MARSIGAPQAMAGPWIARLLEELRTHTDCHICVAAPCATASKSDFEEDGVRYVMLPRRRRVHYWTYSYDGLNAAQALIDDYKPALVHVHGSEHCLGLATTRARHKCATVVSLQGILRAYAPKALGELDFVDVLRSERLSDLVRMTGVMGLRRNWRQGVTVESQVMHQHNHFIGHNEWDRAQLMACNPSAVYHRVGDPLRKEFFSRQWTLAGSQRHTVFFGNLAGAHKGGHTILRAIPILARRFPHISFRVAGRLGTKRGYGRLFMQESERLGVADRVVFLGFLDATQMAEELAKAHVFVSASHIDTNPNSVGEAEAIGVPIVGSYVGGVPEMLDDGRAGLLFPAGDAELLAERVDRIFRDDALATSLSVAGRKQAASRHNPEVIFTELLAAYAAAGCEVRRHDAADCNGKIV
jgi:glycosyltransferase involved in cell wall biosynthesis